MVGTDVVTQAANSTALEINVSGLPAGAHPFQLEIVGRGFAAASIGLLTLTRELTVTGLAVAEGSVAGGTNITIQGAGFDTHNMTNNR